MRAVIAVILHPSQTGVAIAAALKANGHEITGVAAGCLGLAGVAAQGRCKLRVRQRGNLLISLRVPCDLIDTEARLILHVTPASAQVPPA